MDYQNYNIITKSPIKTFLSQQVEKAVQQGLRVELVKDEESFLHLQGEWNNLLTNSTANNIFLTWEWISTWWKIYKENFELYLITVRDKEANLVGIGPFKVAKKKFLRFCDISVLEFLGSGVGATPEFLEIVVKNGREEAVLPLIVSTIIMDKTIDIIDLHPYSTNARSREFLETIFKAEKLTSCVVPHSISPIVHLPQTWDEYFQKKSRNFRKKTKEHRNRCTRDLNYIAGKERTYYVPLKIDRVLISTGNSSVLYGKRGGLETISWSATIKCSRECIASNTMVHTITISPDVPQNIQNIILDMC
jgi:hypothetical protein